MSGLLRRHGVMLTDQALSSLSNVIAIVLVARALDATEFGRFMLAYAVLTLVLGVCRSYLGTLISLAATDVEARDRTAAALGLLLLLSPAVIVGVVGTVLVVSPGTSVRLALIMGVATIVVCLQDVARFGASASRRGRAAVASDLTWVVAIALPLVLGLDLEADAAVGVWLGAAVAALVVVLASLRINPSARLGTSLLRSWHPVGGSMALGTVLGAGAMLAVLTVVARTIGAEAVGSLRGAATLLGPINVLFAFIHIGLAPVLVRRDRADDLRVCAGVAAGAGVVVLAWVTVLLLLPTGWGTALLGDTWRGTHALLAWTGAEYVLLAAAAAATLGLKVRQRAGGLLRQKAFFAATTLIAGMAGGILAGAAWGASAGLVVAAAVSASLGWAALRRPIPDAELTTVEPRAGDTLSVLSSDTVAEGGRP